MTFAYCLLPIDYYKAFCCDPLVLALSLWPQAYLCIYSFVAAGLVYYVPSSSCFALCGIVYFPVEGGVAFVAYCWWLSGHLLKSVSDARLVYMKWPC